MVLFKEFAAAHLVVVSIFAYGTFTVSNMPVADEIDGVFQPPRIHGWTAVLARVNDKVPWRVDAVFSSVMLAEKWADSLHDCQTQCAEVRFSEGKLP